MKFVHTADIHLGASPESGEKIGEKREEEIWRAFEKTVMLCKDDKADLLIISGDLFHRQPLVRELKNVSFLFSRIPDTKIVLIAGNHEYLKEGSHYFDVEFPSNFYFIKDDKLSSIYFEDINTCVYGASYTKRGMTDPVYDVMPELDKSRINILAAHGNVFQENDNIHIDRTMVENAGYDYIALGHIHKSQRLSERMVYAGSPEPLDRTETGKHGCFEGDIMKENEKSSLELYFVDMSSREYKTIDCEITPEKAELEVYKEIQDLIAAAGTRNLYTINLYGRKRRGFVIDEKMIKENVNVVHIDDSTKTDIDIDALREKNKDNIIGMFIDRMRGMEQNAVTEKALLLGLEVLLDEDTQHIS